MTKKDPLQTNLELALLQIRAYLVNNTERELLYSAIFDLKRAYKDQGFTTDDKIVNQILSEIDKRYTKPELKDIKEKSKLEPVYDVQCEKELLGNLLWNSDEFKHVVKIVHDEAFSPKHREIYKAMKVLSVSDGKFDSVTVAEQLGKTCKLREIGGVDYIGELVELSQVNANPESYATVIQEKYNIKKRESEHNYLMGRASELKQCKEKVRDIRDENKDV